MRQYTGLCNGLPPVTFEAFPPQAAYARFKLAINSNLQHAPKHGERPGGSHEGVGRKKMERFPNWQRDVDLFLPGVW